MPPTKEPSALSRDEAAAILRPRIQRINQFSFVAWDDCVELLGDDATRLAIDPIRRLGPKPATFYPWNVIDYMTTLKTIPSDRQSQKLT